MSIVNNLPGWKPLDVEFLDKKIEELGLEEGEVKDYVKNNELDSSEINSYIYAALEMGASSFIDKAKEFAPEKEEKIDNFEANIYVNYMDSGFDSCLEELDLTDYSEENLSRFLSEISADDDKESGSESE